LNYLIIFIDEHYTIFGLIIYNIKEFLFILIYLWYNMSNF